MIDLFQRARDVDEGVVAQQAGKDGGVRGGVTTDDHDRIKALEGAVRALRRRNYPATTG